MQNCLCYRYRMKKQNTRKPPTKICHSSRLESKTAVVTTNCFGDICARFCHRILNLSISWPPETVLRCRFSEAIWSSRTYRLRMEGDKSPAPGLHSLCPPTFCAANSKLLLHNYGLIYHNSPVAESGRSH